MHVLHHNISSSHHQQSMCSPPGSTTSLSPSLSLMSSSRNNSCDGGDGGCFSPELDVVSCTPCPQSSASSVDDMKEKRYFCQRCLNHGLEFPRKGHKPFCRYAQCNCEDCMMVEHRRRLNNQLSQRKNELVDGSKRSPPGKKIRDPKCARCTAHGENQALRGHKKSMCPFLKCCCSACGLVETRRKLMARQIKLRRDQQKARNAQFYKPDGDISNEQSATTPPTKDGFLPPAPVSRTKKRSSCSTKSTSSSSSPTGMPTVVDSIPLAASKMPNNINLFPSIKFDLGLLAAQLSPNNFSFAHQFNGHHNFMQTPSSRLFGIEGQKADRILPNDCTASSASSIAPFSALNLVNLNNSSLNAPFLMGDKQALPSPTPLHIPGVEDVKAMMQQQQPLQFSPFLMPSTVGGGPFSALAGFPFNFSNILLNYNGAANPISTSTGKLM